MSVVKAAVAVAVLVAVGYAVYRYADARAFATMLAEAQQRTQQCVREREPGSTYVCSALAYAYDDRKPIDDERMQEIAKSYAEISLKHCHRDLAALREQEPQLKREISFDSRGYLTSWEWKQWREILGKIGRTETSCGFLESWGALHPNRNLTSR